MICRRKGFHALVLFYFQSDLSQKKDLNIVSAVAKLFFFRILGKLSKRFCIRRPCTLLTNVLCNL